MPEAPIPLPPRPETQEGMPHPELPASTTGEGQAEAVLLSDAPPLTAEGQAAADAQAVPRLTEVMTDFRDGRYGDDLGAYERDANAAIALTRRPLRLGDRVLADEAGVALADGRIGAFVPTTEGIRVFYQGTQAGRPVNGFIELDAVRRKPDAYASTATPLGESEPTAEQERPNDEEYLRILAGMLLEAEQKRKEAEDAAATERERADRQEADRMAAEARAAAAEAAKQAAQKEADAARRAQPDPMAADKDKWDYDNQEGAYNPDPPGDVDPPGPIIEPVPEPTPKEPEPEPDVDTEPRRTLPPIIEGPLELTSQERHFAAPDLQEALDFRTPGPGGQDTPAFRRTERMALARAGYEGFMDRPQALVDQGDDPQLGPHEARGVILRLPGLPEEGVRGYLAQFNASTAERYPEFYGLERRGEPIIVGNFYVVDDDGNHTFSGRALPLGLLNHNNLTFDDTVIEIPQNTPLTVDLPTTPQEVLAAHPLRPAPVYQHNPDARPATMSEPGVRELLGLDEATAKLKGLLRKKKKK